MSYLLPPSQLSSFLINGPIFNYYYYVLWKFGDDKNVDTQKYLYFNFERRVFDYK